MDEKKFQVTASLLVEGDGAESWELISKYKNTTQDKVIALEYLGAKSLMGFMMTFGGDPVMIKEVMTKIDLLPK
jgi:hypothetical protein